MLLHITDESTREELCRSEVIVRWFDMDTLVFFVLDYESVAALYWGVNEMHSIDFDC